ncbi:uncharacterized protein F5147DRAFT_776406 [Suillus discolor]|uniref:Uncharacterized protein n=1 Tax=Suillus discolor TaxID=1912936 RepID=A0A9P7JR61_9AGAM|nr:uncharacterized protein F5147DRAFT_776406 [Suillus discolor]KAG2102257.1 hypothetical protein F5147DRAFT_776406 [Suillus discolor]
MSSRHRNASEDKLPMLPMPPNYTPAVSSHSSYGVHDHFYRHGDYDSMIPESLGGYRPPGQIHDEHYSPSEHSFTGDSSTSHSSSSHHSAYMRELESWNDLLKENNTNLEARNQLLQIKLSQLEGELENSKCMYDKLLDCLNSLSTTTPPPSMVPISDPFIAVVQASHYHDVVYWNRDKYMDDYDNGRGTLRTHANDSSGKHGFLEDEDGVICSQKRQQEMHKYQMQLWHTLRRYNHAPVTWMKIDSLAAEYFRCSMRTKFIELCLCHRDWKTDLLAICHYSQWSDRPRTDDMIIIKQEAPNCRVKQEFQPSSTKRPASLTLLKPAHADKKTHALFTNSNVKLPRSTSTTTHSRIAVPVVHSDAFDHVMAPSLIHPAKSLPEKNSPNIDTMPNEGSLPTVSPSITMPNSCSTVPQPLKIISALDNVFDGDTEQHNTIMNSAALASTSLAELLEKKTVSDRTNLPVPPSATSRLAFLESLHSALTTSAKGSITPSSSITQPENIALSTVTAAAIKNGRNTTNTQAEYRPNKSFTARNLCGIEWKKSHKKGTAGEFATYWTSLPEEQKDAKSSVSASLRVAGVDTTPLPLAAMSSVS